MAQIKLRDYGKRKLWLYKEGNEYINTTGGWKQHILYYNGETFNSSYSAFSKETNYIRATLNRNNLAIKTGLAICFSNESKINLTNYSKIYLHSKLRKMYNSNSDLTIRLMINQYLCDYKDVSSINNIDFTLTNNETIENELKVLDVSTFIGDYYIWLMIENAAGTNTTVIGEFQFDKIWLE